MNKFKKFFILTLQLALMFSPLVFAQLPPALPDTPARDLNDIFDIIAIAITWLFWLLIILSVFFFILAAFEYLTSAGDKEKTEKAKNRIIYGIVALVVAILAKGIPAIVGNFLNVGSISPGL